MNRRNAVMRVVMGTIGGYITSMLARAELATVYKPPMWTEPEKHRFVLTPEQVMDALTEGGK